MSATDFRSRLRRLRKDPPRETAPLEPTPLDLAGGHPGETGEPKGLQTRDGGRTWFREASFALDVEHGDFALGEVSAAHAAEFVLLTGDKALADLDLFDAVYLDTETTGLSGGAGTYVFMVGLGTFEFDGDGGPRFQLWQGFLRDPGGEAELLEECAGRIRARGSLVSFFGKSFDRHRLEDKMRLCAVSAPFDGRPHLDLYHPCRRLYRGAYPDGRLKTLEAELCGLERASDLPGSMAPEAWFNYLAGRPHRLAGVFQHNLLDVLSLVTLAAHLGRSRLETRADRSPLAGDPGTRAAGIARAELAAGRSAEGLLWLERALERQCADARSLALLRADLLRREGSLDAAQAALEEFVVHPEDEHTAPALVSQAKCLEHRSSDPVAALGAARRALEVNGRCGAGARGRALNRDLEGRIARLLRRVEG
ncbi:MAG: ribonuclease H-like domain-containing protein [bacterium]|nr:hypothetical protein [Planctomycetota bacterium]HIL51647.1 hypothetical protein [Planctomycetota bacterium]